MFLRNLQNSQEKTYVRVYFLMIKLQVCGLLFSCEFCDIFKNTFFTEHLRATTFEPNITYSMQKPLVAKNHKNFSNSYVSICSAIRVRIFKNKYFDTLSSYHFCCTASKCNEKENLRYLGCINPSHC